MTRPVLATATGAQSSPAPPSSEGDKRALLVYFSLSNQAHRVANRVAEALTDDGWQVEVRRILWVDERYQLTLPLEPFWRTMFRMLIPQLVHRTGKFELEGEPITRAPDLLVVGSPTWWGNPAMPIVSFMKSALASQLLAGTPFAIFTVCRASWKGNYRWLRRRGQRLGGRFVAHQEYCFDGNHAQSILSFIFRIRDGRPRQRFLSARVPDYGISARYLAKTGQFIERITKEEYNGYPKAAT